MKALEYQPGVWRWAVITAVSIWALLSLAFGIHGDDVSPLDCLILGALALAGILPAGVKRWWDIVVGYRGTPYLFLDVRCGAG